MKMSYEKPEILFVSFELSQDIAGGCELISNHGDGACAIYVPDPGWEGITVYSDGCVATPPNPNAGDEPCYHVPQARYNVYSS